MLTLVFYFEQISPTQIKVKVKTTMMSKLYFKFSWRSKYILILKNMLQFETLLKIYFAIKVNHKYSTLVQIQACFPTIK